MEATRKRNDFTLNAYALMPSQSGVTINGTQLNLSIAGSTIGTLALWFPRPLIPALMHQKVGVLRLIQTDANRYISVYRWDVFYPGIYPIFGVATPVGGLQAVFDCYRPGLPYTFFYA